MIRLRPGPGAPQRDRPVNLAVNRTPLPTGFREAEAWAVLYVWVDTLSTGEHSTHPLARARALHTHDSLASRPTPREIWA